MQESIQNKDAAFKPFPPAKEELDFVKQIQSNNSKVDTIIVLDDDPTGTQTVYNVPVLTTWTVDVLLEEFRQKTSLFYILTNSRSLTSEEAIRLTIEIGKNIRTAATQANTQHWVISRSDSTLRGHYPAEVEALANSLNLQKGVCFLIPAFFEGGRYTLNNIHYVEDKEKLIPASQTIYAQDHVFGYQSSNLGEWVLEKTNGSIPKEQIKSISISELRTNSTETLIQKINGLAPNSVCIVNAITYADLHHFSLAILHSSVYPIFRTAASFVASIAGQMPKSLLEKKDLIKEGKQGGLIIVGSYVAKTSQQLQDLLAANITLNQIEVNIPKALALENTEQFCSQVASKIDQAIQSGQLVVLYTSRNLISAKTEEEKQNIGKRVSAILTTIMAELEVRPSFILTKGGITSSDIATKGLGIKRAMVLGQIIKGVPVWQLGEETKFPGLSQIIFPGNVGQVNSITEIIHKLST